MRSGLLLALAATGAACQGSPETGTEFRLGYGVRDGSSGDFEQGDALELGIHVRPADWLLGAEFGLAFSEADDHRAGFTPDVATLELYGGPLWTAELVSQRLWLDLGAGLSLTGGGEDVESVLAEIFQLDDHRTDTWASGYARAGLRLRLVERLSLRVDLRANRGGEGDFRDRTYSGDFEQLLVSLSVDV